MGQYWVVANLDKKEFINPHNIGSSSKLWEQVNNLPGTPVAMFILCTAMREPRGGGDFQKDLNNVIGRWVGDKVVVVGDYAATGDYDGVGDLSNVYANCSEYAHSEWKEISHLVRPIIEKECGGTFKKTDYGTWNFIADEG